MVCKKINIRRQTTFVCATCHVPLCAPVLTERTRAPIDCFHKYHESKFVSSDFSTASLDESVSSYNSEDEWFERKPQAKKQKDNKHIDFAEI